MPIKLTIIFDDSEVDNIDAADMAALDVDVRHGVIGNLTDISIDMSQIILFCSRNTANLLSSLQRIRSTYPSSKIIVGVQCCSSLVSACIQSGVAGLLCVPFTPARLADVVRRVSGGQFFLDDEIAQVLAMRHIKKALEPFAILSSREFDVFCLLAEGCSLQIISQQLGISQKTVSNCQTQLKLKLRIENRGEMAVFAKRHGLIR